MGINLMCIAVVLVTVTLTGCHPRAVIAGPIEIGPTPLLVTLDNPVSAIGPLHEFCFRPALKEVGLEPDGRLWVPGRRPGFIGIRIVMIAQTGQRHSVTGTPQEYSDLLCFETVMEEDAARRYTGFEISADTAVAISEVRWWSGTRTAFL